MTSVTIYRGYITFWAPPTHPASVYNTFHEHWQILWILVSWSNGHLTFWFFLYILHTILLNHWLCYLHWCPNLVFHQETGNVLLHFYQILQIYNNFKMQMHIWYQILQFFEFCYTLPMLWFAENANKIYTRNLHKIE